MNRFIVDCERWVARYSDRIVVVAERDREKGLKAGVGREEQYVLIESAVPLAAFDPGSVNGCDFRQELGVPEGAPIVGTVGRFAYQKAPEVMLGAAREILTHHSQVHFVYVGDGPLKQQVLDGLGDFPGHPRLHLVGLRRDIPRIVAAFDVFLLSSRYEGLPRVVVEAMALEKPVVSTPADGVVDVVLPDRTGIIVPQGDTAAMARATLDLLKEPDRRRELGATARTMVRDRFDLGRMIRQIENLYEELLVEKGLER
jgi:glycosyltransferase involved in cell wall biosynthesis